MEIISSEVLVSADVVEQMYNSNYGCRDYCLNACTCTGNCDN